MPRVPQAPPPGVVRFATPEATPGRWYDANLVRFRGGQLQPIGGNVALPASGVADLPRDLLTWHDNSYVRWAAFGTDSKLYVYRFDLQTLTDITPAGVGPLDPPGALVGYGLGDYGASTYGTARDPADIGPQDIAASQGDIWSLATFGEDLLFVPTQDGHLYVWSPATPTDPAVLVTEAPAQNRGVIVTDQRQVVLLGAGGDPRNIAWSDQENYHVWAPDVINLAGSKLLVTQSYVMCAIKITTGLLIYTANDVHLMAYVGPPYAYGIVQIAAGCGPMSLRSVVSIGNLVMWPGLQNFWQYNGTVQPMKCDVQDWFYSLVNRQMIGRVFGSPNAQFSEVWWDWPDEGASECDRYVAVNYGDVTITPVYTMAATQPWTIGVRTRTAADPTGTMDFPVLGGPLDSGGSLFLHEFGWLDNGVPRAANGEVYAESGNIVVGEGDKRFHVKQLVFDATSAVEDILGYRFFVREQPGDAAGEVDTGVYTVIHNGLMDMRFSGRSIRMRMEALADASFAVGKPRLEVRPGGRR
jgi:hypothetical protein